LNVTGNGTWGTKGAVIKDRTGRIVPNHNATISNHVKDGDKIADCDLTFRDD